MSVSRSLIVNAEDFGRSLDINQGIIEAHERGVVTSASLMVRHGAAPAAATYARSRQNLSVGLHFDFGEWIYRNDTWLRVGNVVPLDDERAVAKELVRQLSSFRQLMGTDPSHLDSHQHVHRSGPLASELVSLARELGLPLRHYTSEVSYCGELYGQTSNGFPLPEGIMTDALIRILSVLPAGVTELTCHPGKGSEPHSRYRAEGVEECRTLCDPRVQAALEAQGIKLCTFHDVRMDRHSALTYRERSFQDRGIAAFNRGDYADADSWFRRVTVIYPSRSAAWLWLSRTQAKLGNSEGARQSINNALDLQSGSREAKEHVEALLAGNGNKTNHLALMQRARIGLQTDPATLDLIGEWKAIEPLSDEMIDGTRLARIAEKLWASGHMTAACEAFKRAVTLNPDDLALRHCYEMAIGETLVLSGSWKYSEEPQTKIKPIHGRILHLVNKSLPYSQVGYTVRTHSLAKAQRDVGLDPHVVTSLGFPLNHGIETASLSDQIDDIHYHRLKGANGIPSRLDVRLSQNVLELTKLTKELRPAVLHAASDYQNALIALEVGRQCGIPVVYEVRGFWEDAWLSKQDPEAILRDRYLYSREQELRCMHAADRVVTLAEVMKQRMVNWGISAEKIVVIPNAVDCDKFVPVRRDPQLIRKLGIEPGEVVIGYISTFWRFEGIQYLIAAFAKLINSRLRIRLLLVGDGEDRLRLEAHATALGIMDRVIFTGTVPHEEILRYYGIIDVFVVPRTADSISKFVTPLKPLEAMATARAVVVSQVPALEEMIQDGVTGRVFSPEDPDSLAGVIEPLLTDPARRNNLGQAAREWVRQHRTWSGNAMLYRNMYERLEAL